MRAGVRLGIDLGQARVGVAASDAGGLVATPVETVRQDSTGSASKAVLDRIQALVHEREAVEVVVGLPRSLSGREGPAAQAATAFAHALATRLSPVTVRLVDERLSTLAAERGLRATNVDSRRGRAVVDQAAAAIILQGALDAERNSGNPPGTTVQVEE